MKAKNKGIVLIIVLLIISVMLILGASLARILISGIGSNLSLINRAKVFYIAEGGIEYAKCEIIKNPGFYTDLSLTGDEKNWIIKEAKGFKAGLGDGKFKIVKEKDKAMIYSAGYLGSDEKKSKALAIIKIKYSYPPFKQISWEML